MKARIRKKRLARLYQLSARNKKRLRDKGILTVRYWDHFSPETGSDTAW